MSVDLTSRCGCGAGEAARRCSVSGARSWICSGTVHSVDLSDEMLALLD